jgi:translation initiation factor 2 subunit 2
MTDNNQPDIIKLNSIDSFKIINPNLENETDTVNGDEDENIGFEIQDDTKINTNTNSDTVYNVLLDEIYDTINDNNQLFGNNSINISKPDIKYENRKTFWYNYGKNCSQINRTPDRLKRFIEKEMAVETSINEKKQLIIRGRYTFAMIGSAYKKYIKNFVQCSTCKSINTEIIRNSLNRLDYLKCLNPKCNTCKVVLKM